jgi:hypothetical protein
MASEIILPRNQMHSEEKVDKIARDYAAFIASAYIPSTNRITLLDLNTDILDLESLLNLCGGQGYFGNQLRIQNK